MPEKDDQDRLVAREVDGVAQGRGAVADLGDGDDYFVGVGVLGWL